MCSISIKGTYIVLPCIVKEYNVGMVEVLVVISVKILKLRCHIKRGIESKNKNKQQCKITVDQYQWNKHLFAYLMTVWGKMVIWLGAGQLVRGLKAWMVLHQLRSRCCPAVLCKWCMICIYVQLGVHLYISYIFISPHISAWNYKTRRKCGRSAKCCSELFCDLFFSYQVVLMMPPTVAVLQYITGPYFIA